MAVKKSVAPVENKSAETTATPVKTESAKEVTTKTAAAKAEPVKKEAVKATVKEAVKETAKKAPTQASAKKATEKKAPAKKEPAKKAAAKKTELKSAVHIQFSGKSYSQEDIMKMATDVWKFDLKQKVGDLASVELYVKPEENMVYYVMNKEFTGSFSI